MPLIEHKLISCLKPTIMTFSEVFISLQMCYLIYFLEMWQNLLRKANNKICFKLEIKHNQLVLLNDITFNMSKSTQ